MIALFVALLLMPSFASAQALYLSPYTGDGSEATPFRAHGVGQGAECKSLRADETKAQGYALCSGPVVPVQPGVIDISGKRAILKADRDKILAERGISLTASTTDGLLSELVDGQGVKLGREGGKQAIFVKGQVVWTRPAPLSSYIPDAVHVLNVAFHLPVLVPSYLASSATAWAISALIENWNCADDTVPNYTCQYTWVLSTGTTATMEGNALRNTNSVSSNVLYNDAALDSSDMRHRVTVSSIDRGTATNVAGGAAIRNPGTGVSTYVYCVLRDAATDQAELGHVSAGALTTDSTVSVTVSNGDTIEAVGIGDQVSCRHNGATVLGPITENTGNGNVNINVRFSGSGTATTTSVVLDDSRGEVVLNRRRAVVRF